MSKARNADSSAVLRVARADDPQTNRELPSYGDRVDREVVKATLVTVVDDRRNHQTDQQGPDDRPPDVQPPAVHPPDLDPQHELARRPTQSDGEHTDFDREDDQGVPLRGALWRRPEAVTREDAHGECREDPVDEDREDASPPASDGAGPALREPETLSRPVPRGRAGTGRRSHGGNVTRWKQARHGGETRDT